MESGGGTAVEKRMEVCPKPSTELPRKLCRRVRIFGEPDYYGGTEYEGDT